MKRIIKKICGGLMALALVLSMVPAIRMSAKAAETEPVRFPSGCDILLGILPGM